MSDIVTLFARDPLTYSEADLETIVSELRKSRAAFNLGNVKAGSTKPPTEKQKKLGDMLKGLDLDI